MFCFSQYSDYSEILSDIVHDLDVNFQFLKPQSGVVGLRWQWNLRVVTVTRNLVILGGCMSRTTRGKLRFVYALEVEEDFFSLSFHYTICFSPHDDGKLSSFYSYSLDHFYLSFFVYLHNYSFYSSVQSVNKIDGLLSFISVHTDCLRLTCSYLCLIRNTIIWPWCWEDSNDFSFSQSVFFFFFFF